MLCTVQQIYAQCSLINRKYEWTEPAKICIHPMLISVPNPSDADANLSCDHSYQLL